MKSFGLKSPNVTGTKNKLCSRNQNILLFQIKALCRSKHAGQSFVVCHGVKFKHAPHPLGGLQERELGGYRLIYHSWAAPLWLLSRGHRSQQSNNKTSLQPLTNHKQQSTVVPGTDWGKGKKILTSPPSRSQKKTGETETKGKKGKKKERPTTAPPTDKPPHRQPEGKEKKLLLHHCINSRGISGPSHSCPTQRGNLGGTQEAFKSPINSNISRVGPSAILAADSTLAQWRSVWL